MMYKKSVKEFIRYIVIIAAAVMICAVGSFESAAAVKGSALSRVSRQDLRTTSDYLRNAISDPQVSGTGGDWYMMALARSAQTADAEYFNAYYKNVEKTVRKSRGELHRKKVTDNCRVILALTAMGKDASKTAGYDLTEILGDYERVTAQGLNGPVWALIALDSGDYDILRNDNGSSQTTREKLIDHILAASLEDGGWNMAGKGDADPDMTAMVLQALAKYRTQDKVSTAVNKAVSRLSQLQNSSGGFASCGIETSESASQVIVALCELGIPLTDKRFVKNGRSVWDNLQTYRMDDGSFRHTAGTGPDMMATEQAFYAMTAAWRAAEGKSSLYRMTDR